MWEKAARETIIDGGATNFVDNATGVKPIQEAQFC